MVAGFAVIALVGSAVGAVAASSSTPQPGATYLALGDSIAFGYQESNATTPPNYLNAASLVGYPEDVASDLHLQVANAACPGETTGSFIRSTVQSNGCESSPGGGPGYRSGYLLHEDYTYSQLTYAANFLKKHPQTSLITLQLGANDGLLCQETTPDTCQSEQGTVLNKVGSNINRILGALRGKDGYTGQIVLVTYYSIDYGNNTDNFNSYAVNHELTLNASKYNAIVADGFNAFLSASEAQGTTDPCAAGLLVPLSSGGCGIHPTATGQEVLAQAVESALSSSSS